MKCVYSFSINVIFTKKTWERTWVLMASLFDGFISGNPASQTGGFRYHIWRQWAVEESRAPDDVVSRQKLIFLLDLTFKVIKENIF